jgi:hypothetical protein
MKQLSGFGARECPQMGRVAQVSSIRQQRRAWVARVQRGAAAESDPSRAKWISRRGGGHDPRDGQH